MASEAAKAVAQEVLSTVRKGLIPNKGEIIKKHGYKDSVSKKPKKVTETKSYKEEMKPLLDRLDEERNEIIKRLKVTRNKAKYRDLIDGMDKVTKNIQLLNGGKTSSDAISISWE